MEGGNAEEGQAVDIAEMNLSGEEEEGSEEEEEDNWACEVGVVHYVLVYPCEGVQDC